MVEYKIGADPELVLLVDNNPCSADEFFEFETQGIGTDGCSDTVELRPVPSVSVLAVVSSIQQLFQECYRENNSIDFIAGAYYNSQPIGGHIHFGYRKNSERITYDTPINIEDAVKLIDKVYFPWEDKIIDKNQRDSRNDSYGGRGDWKLQPHGFEYRTPFSWLYNPTIAIAAIGLAEIGFNMFLQDKTVKEYLTVSKIIKDLESGVLISPEKEEKHVIFDCIVKSSEYKKIDYTQPIIRNWL